MISIYWVYIDKLISLDSTGLWTLLGQQLCYKLTCMLTTLQKRYSFPECRIFCEKKWIKPVTHPVSFVHFGDLESFRSTYKSF